MSAGLVVSDLTVRRGSASIVSRCALRAPRGHVTVLLGPNGAGKTTLLEGISGVLRSTHGEITLDGREIGALSRRRRAARGLAHVEQGRTVFTRLTAVENLRVGTGAAEAVDAALHGFPELERRRHLTADRLSGGEQQMLVLARALARRPCALLLDEMSLGLAPGVVRRLMSRVRGLADAGAAVLLVEQFARLALEIGDHAYVLSRGRIVYDGGCERLLDRPEVLRGAYLAAKL